MESKLGLSLLIKEMGTYSARTYKAYVTGKKICLSQYHDLPQFMQEAT